MRTIVLGVDKRITESIKWGGPTFSFEGNIATIPPRTKKAVQLFFQQGALIGARYGVLEGDGDQVRTINFKDKAEIAPQKSRSRQSHQGLDQTQRRLSHAPPITAAVPTITFSVPP